jgi:protein TonB
LARRKKSSSSLVIGIAVGLHVAVAAVLMLIPQQKLREIVAIAMSEAEPKKEEKKADPPKPPQRSPDRPARSAARNTRPAAAAAPEAQSQGANAFTDIGLALDSSASDGIAVAIAKPEPVAAPVATAPPRPKVLVARKTEGACEEPLVRPRLIKPGRPPGFTEEARKARVQGAVRVAVDVDENGNVVSAHVLKGLGYGLDEAALESAGKATFAAATRCNKPVAATFIISMRFRASS